MIFDHFEFKFLGSPPVESNRGTELGSLRYDGIQGIGQAAHTHKEEPVFLPLDLQQATFFQKDTVKVSAAKVERSERCLRLAAGLQQYHDLEDNILSIETVSAFFGWSTSLLLEGFQP
eukprot:s4924_g2.t1